MADIERYGSGLFRREVSPDRGSELGEVIFSSPISIEIMAFFSVALIAGITALGYFGTYTKKNTVIGQIVPTSGIMRIYTPQAGVVLKSYVHEGQYVRSGDTLFIVSSEKRSSQGETQAAISSSVRTRQQLLANEIGNVRSIANEDRTGAERKVQSDKRALANAEEMIEIQKQRVAVSQGIAQRYKQLLASQYVSEADVQNKLADLLDQQSRLTSLEKDRADAEKGLASSENDLRDLPLKTADGVAEMQREAQNASEDLLESEGRRTLNVVAPQSGIITAISANIGQVAETNAVMASIVPSGIEFEAELYATSKAIGFVKVGDPVVLRYEAYPYQHFGTYDGSVKTISKTALSAQEISNIGDLLLQRSDAADRNAPLYRIGVKLDTQMVVAYGRKQPLQSGMLLEADILQETHRLYEWILEPLYELDLPEFDH